MVLIQPTTPTIPLARTGLSLTYSDRGAFWLFGGYANGNYYSALWKYSRDNKAYTLVDGDETPNVISAEKPSTRAWHSSWVDGNGDLWINGGYAYGFVGYTLSKLKLLCLSLSIHMHQILDVLISLTFSFSAGPLNGDGFIGDTWVYKTSENRWVHVTGLINPKAYVTNTLEPRALAGYWKDENDQNFYIFGGFYEYRLLFMSSSSRNFCT